MVHVSQASGGVVYHVNMSFSFPPTNPNNPSHTNWGGSLVLVLTTYNGSSLSLVNPVSPDVYDLAPGGNLLFYLFDVTPGSSTNPSSPQPTASWLTGNSVGTTNLLTNSVPATANLYSVGLQSSPGIGDGTSSYPCWVVGSSPNDPWVGDVSVLDNVSFQNVTFQFTVNPPSGQGWSQTTFGDDPNMIVTPGGN